jgi:peptide/nickel transport system permease protein
VLNFIGRRILYSVPVLAVASFILFWGVRLTFDPTDKFRASRDSARIIAEKRHELGLDRPIIAQWWTWLTHFVRGDWGVSSSTNGDVFEMTMRALGFTLQLIFWGILLSLIVAVTVGVFSAVHQYSVPDYIFTGLSYLGIALPVFWFALMANQFLSIVPQEHFHLRDPPLYFVGLHSTGRSGVNLDYFRHLALPVLTLTVQIIAVWSRFQRAAMLDVYTQTTCVPPVQRAFPSPGDLQHSLEMRLSPCLADAVDIGALFGGLLITEQIYSIPGMGRLF